jgi:flavorubredoxin
VTSKTTRAGKRVTIYFGGTGSAGGGGDGKKENEIDTRIHKAKKKVSLKSWEVKHRTRKEKKREIIRKGGHFARGNLDLLLDDDDVR